MIAIAGACANTAMCALLQPAAVHAICSSGVPMQLF